MAEQSGFPQIPATVWWGVRDILKRSPNAALDAAMLSAQLGVQGTAAKQYLLELQKIGILAEDGKATDLAKRWRQDDEFELAANEISQKNYPDSLRDVAPPESGNRDTIIRWFIAQNLGEGSAKNKTATYLLIGNPTLPENGSPVKRITPNNRSPRPSKASTLPSGGQHKTYPTTEGTRKKANSATEIPLNVNLQIHISADASNDQIETIFSAMKKYLRND